MNDLWECECELLHPNFRLRQRSETKSQNKFNQEAEEDQTTVSSTAITALNPVEVYPEQLENWNGNGSYLVWG